MKTKKSILFDAFFVLLYGTLAFLAGFFYDKEMGYRFVGLAISTATLGIIIAILVWSYGNMANTPDRSPIPLLEFVRDGDVILIRGISPHMIDKGKTTLHLLVEYSIRRAHCTIDASNFDTQPMSPAYFKRAGDKMVFVQHF